MSYFIDESNDEQSLKFDEDDAVLCPVCDYYCNHHDGDIIEQQLNRGTLVRIPFTCECEGHRWELRINFHKGSLGIFTKIIDRTPRDNHLG